MAEKEGRYETETRGIKDVLSSSIPDSPLNVEKQDFSIYFRITDQNRAIPTAVGALTAMKRECCCTNWFYHSAMSAIAHD